MSETPSSPSNQPVYIALILVGCLALAVHFFPIAEIIESNVSVAVRLLQAATGIVYLLIISKFIIDSNLIKNYDPSKGSAAIIGRYGGPVGSLLTEATQIIAFIQLGMLLFQGITFNQWNHDFSVNGPNYWLLTVLAILISAKALFDLASRFSDLRYYWSNLAELIDENPWEGNSQDGNGNQSK